MHTIAAAPNTFDSTFQRLLSVFTSGAEPGIAATLTGRVMPGCGFDTMPRAPGVGLMTLRTSPDTPNPRTAYTSHRNFGESRWPFGKRSSMMTNNVATFPPGAFQKAESSKT